MSDYYNPDIPKIDGSRRPLGILIFGDKVAQRAEDDIFSLDDRYGL